MHITLKGSAGFPDRVPGWVTGQVPGRVPGRVPHGVVSVSLSGVVCILYVDWLEPEKAGKVTRASFVCWASFVYWRENFVI